VPCFYGDQYNVLFPVAEANAIFISTRVSKTYYIAQSGCDDAPVPQCADRSTTAYSKEFYYANIENFTIFIEHNVRGNQIDLTALSTQLQGQLINSKGKVVKEMKQKNRNGDIFTVGELLTAAGITLEDPSESPLSAGESLRHAGSVIIVFVTYSNELWDSRKISYTYRLAYISGAEFKAEQPQILDNNDMIVYNRHGIRMVFVQTGTIGTFSFLVLLINLVSAGVLVKFATLFVDYVALRVLPQSKLYRSYKFESTVDFTDLRRKEDGPSVELVTTTTTPL